jgi:hypothetical protein
MMRDIINIVTESAESPAKTVVRLFRAGAPAGKYDVDLGASSDGETVVLHNIAVYDRGKGIGNKVLGFLTGLADEHRVRIELEVGPQEDIEGEGDVLDGGRLVRWYTSHGFDWHEDGGYMIRHPQP